MKTLSMFFLLFLIISCNNSKTDQNSITKKTEVVLEKAKPSILSKISITDVSLKCRGNGTRSASVYGSGVTIYFTIKNNSNVGLKKIFFNGVFNYEGRNFSHSEKINYEFRKGLESGESQKIAMRPGVLSNWNNKIKPIDKGKLNLKVLSVLDYNDYNHE